MNRLLFMLLVECAPFFLGVALVVVILKYALQFFFRKFSVHNYTSPSPSGLISWTRLAPHDILFRLGFLAALNVVLYWLPVYYWTTYTPSGDDRDGVLLLYAAACSPVSWVLGVLCYVQSWMAQCRVRQRVPFHLGCTLLIAVIGSTVIPLVQFYVRISRF